MGITEQNLARACVWYRTEYGVLPRQYLHHGTHDKQRGNQMITFRSQASGDVMMFGDVARQMLRIIGKEPAGEGIVTAKQLPAAIAALKDDNPCSGMGDRPRRPGSLTGGRDTR